VPGNTAKPPAFKPALVVDIYRKHLGGGSDKPPALKRVMLLELSQYLENYLWPHFSAEKASYEHVMSIVLLINEKFRENVPAWGVLEEAKVWEWHSSANRHPHFTNPDTISTRHTPTAALRLRAKP
jgi:hypothetical protein